MHRNTLWLIGAMFGMFVVTTWASNIGLGVPQPEKNPLSIREDSARGQRTGSGHYRTRYFFIGGGMHGGK